MTTTVDLAALAAAGDAKVTLLGGTITSQGSTGTDYAGFGDADSVYVEAKVQLRDNSRGAAQLTLVLQGSDNGVSWSTLQTFTFTNNGTQTATVDTPNAHLRVSWSVARNTEWFIDHVTVAPASLNAPGGGGGGGSQTVKCVRFPITFGTPGLVPESFPITAVDVDALTITVAGDRRTAFAVGVAFVINGSSANDQPGTVTSASLVGGDTVIAGSFFFLDPTVDGNAVVSVGTVVYTPVVGDILLGNVDSPITLVSVSEAWDGATPNLRVLTEAYRQAQSTAFVNLDATIADDPAGVSLMLNAPPGFPVGANWRLWRFTTADPIIVTVDDNNGLDPGATQGAAEIVFLVLSAQ